MIPIIVDFPGKATRTRWECSECGTYLDTDEDECPECGVVIDWEAVENEELGIGKFKPVRY